MPIFLEPIQNGRRIVLDKAILFIGRHPECDIVLTRSRKVSRKHCCIAQVNDSVVIRDLGSLNGIRVNRQRVRKESWLQLGDEVAIGDCTYVVQAEGHPSPAKRSEKNTGDSAAAPRIQKPAAPLNISQDFPIPIDEPDEEFAGGPPAPKTPDSIPLAMDDELVEISDQDIDLLDDSNEF